MTLPGAGREGEAWIVVHADTDHVEREIEQGVSRAAEGAESDLKKTGNDIGDTLSDGISDELRTHGRDFQESIERATKGRTIRTKFGWRDQGTGRFVKRLGDDVEEEIEHAFSNLGRSGGPISSFGQGVADAVGSAFNVSGRSPLIAVLGVAILAIVGVVLAAVQAVAALVAVLGTLPALLTAIGLQVGVVMIAFNGVGEAVKGAFAAKNAKELNEALKNLTPSAQKFVKSLLPAKQLFADIKKIVQEGFFQGLGDSVGRVLANLGPILRNNFGPLAVQMGKFLGGIADFFASKQFQQFFASIFPATIAFLERFGPAFVDFLKGLITIATASMPFLIEVGNILSGTFQTIGLFLDSAPHNSNFMGWLRDMADTLVSLQGLFFSILGFLREFMEALDEGGGKDIIDEMSRALQELAFFLSTDIGKASIRALVNLGILGIQSLTGLILLILGVLGALQMLGEFFTGPFPMYFEAGLTAIGIFFSWLGGLIVGAFDWLVDKVTDATAWLINFILRWLILGRGYITTFVNDIKALPGKILSAVANFGALLIERGRALIDGLINGIRSKFGELRNAARTLASIIVANLPGSPAEEGPLSGKGYSLYRGQALVEDFAKGIKMEGPTLKDASMDAVSNIVFGPNSVRVGFEGVVPTPQQARITGSAAGQGILSQLAARNTRLAVRTL